MRSPLGGYTDVALKAGAGTPVTLPAVQIDLGSKQVYRHGPNPEAFDRLLDRILEFFDSQPDSTGRVGEINCTVLDEFDGSFANDPSYWPRIFLDAASNLQVQARDGVEAEAFMFALASIIRSPTLRDHSGWQSGEIVSGTPHSFRLAYDEVKIKRVIAKIIYALAFLRFGYEVSNYPLVRRFKDFVIGTGEEEPAIRLLYEPGTVQEWLDHHIAAIGLFSGQAIGFVCLYGGCHEAILDPELVWPIHQQSIVALARTEGTDTRLVSNIEAAPFLAFLEECTRHNSATLGLDCDR